MKFSLSTPHINDILHGIVARNVNVKITLLSNFYAEVSFLQIYGHIFGRNDENSIALIDRDSKSYFQQRQLFCEVQITLQ